jgi:hypothetical protein
MSAHVLLLQSASTITFRLSMLIKYKANTIIISFKFTKQCTSNLFSPWYSGKVVWLALNYNHSLKGWKDANFALKSNCTLSSFEIPITKYYFSCSGIFYAYPSIKSFFRVKRSIIHIQKQYIQKKMYIMYIYISCSVRWKV